MIKVTRLYCRSFDLDHLDVFWETEDFDAAENIRKYSFFVLRSESYGGPWETISPALKDVYYFRDALPVQMHKWRTLYYKLKIVDTETQEEQEVAATAQQGEADLIAYEIIRQEDVLFREFIGRRCWLFPVKTFGPKCVCYDKTHARRTRSNCLTCFDTGYLGGFHAPIECFIQFDPAANTPTLAPIQEQQFTNTMVRLISFPPVKPKDILVETENRRWRVVTSQNTQRLRAVVHQEITVHEIPRGDIEFKLPVNIADLRTLEPAAERNFTNPQHPDGMQSENIDDILAVYQGRPRGAA